MNEIAFIFALKIKIFVEEKPAKCLIAKRISKRIHSDFQRKVKTKSEALYIILGPNFNRHILSHILTKNWCRTMASLYKNFKSRNPRNGECYKSC